MSKKNKGIIILLALFLVSIFVITILKQYQKKISTGSLSPSIGSIYPEPSSSLSSKIFEQSTNSPDAPFAALEDSSICIELWGEGLIEPGKYDSTHDEILKQFHLSVNNHEYTGQPIVYSAASTGRTIAKNPETGELGYYIPPGFPIVLCYFIYPVPDNYEVVLTFVKAPYQELKHSWKFSLVDD